MGVAGVFLSTPLLQMMNTDPDVLPLASLYLRIYFLGIPATVVYNFGAAILRAIGDTDRPLMFLLLSGVINVILNLLTVIVFKLDVAASPSPPPSASTWPPHWWSCAWSTPRAPTG